MINCSSGCHLLELVLCGRVSTTVGVQVPVEASLLPPAFICLVGTASAVSCGWSYLLGEGSWEAGVEPVPCA